MATFIKTKNCRTLSYTGLLQQKHNAISAEENQLLDAASTTSEINTKQFFTLRQH